MSIITGQHFGVEVCKIFNLPPNEVKKLMVEIPADGLVVLHTTALVEKEQSEKLLTLLQENKEKVTVKKEVPA